ncbi:4Fe-4S cluster-binding domain-containing protein [Lacrimispora sp.]|uniref:4Fe-4S cluster-binding domain-containing protein n=1 Tax=Lacrimispora sp. TaxID=2719234 RepID=UPI00289D5FED|nr:4Fe-4S cluster-binding domain-containing protein [Lacrimispora sp.]
MKDTARVIVTYDCPRSCPNCCNEHIGNVPAVNFEDLLKYKELVITGGEPMMIGARVVEMIHRIRQSGYAGKIWLYTAELNVQRWADKMVLQEVDGITYTFHYEYSQRDITLLKRLTGHIKELNKTGGLNSRSFRLLIDRRLEKEIDWKDIKIPGVWDEVRLLKWKDDECPLPDNEELIYYDLERE